MAKPKHKFLVEVLDKAHAIHVWSDNNPLVASEINHIEGVSLITFDNTIIIVMTDPRYDISEIADEIRELLQAEVPDVFKED